MINITQQGEKITTYKTEFTVDKEDEIINLPKYPNVAIGSMCLCIEDSSVYILNGENKWVTL